VRAINCGHTRIGASLESVLRAAARIAQDVACGIVPGPPAIDARQILPRNEDRDRPLLAAEMSGLLQRRTNACVNCPRD